MDLIQPKSEAELADALRDANAPLYVSGGDTRPVGQSRQNTRLSTLGLRGITLYEPDALTLVANAGTPISEIRAELDMKGQRLAFDPPDWRNVLGRAGSPTIGGAVATNASGPARMVLGACRDFLLGVRFVDGTGRVVKNGGRVMKNVTGYDLTKLMAGSYGTLGVLSEVSLKVLPHPQTEATLCLVGLTDERAIEALSSAMCSPFEVTGAAHLPSEGQTVIRIEGFDASVDYRLEALQRRLRPFGRPMPITFDWTSVRDLSPFVGKPGTIWRFVCPPSKAPGLVAACRDIAHVEVIYDWAGGLVWIQSPSDANLRDAASPWPGMIMRDARNDWPIMPNNGDVIGRLTQGLKTQFDPKGLFKPVLWSAS